jgi:uncharacterized phage protein gp47/JayE
MSDISDLARPLSFNEIRTSIYSVLASTGVTTSNWKPGAVVRTVISAVAIVLAGLSAFISALAASAFLPLASGEWLRLVALYVYNVVRIEATFAAGEVTITNSGGGIYTLDPGDLTFRNPVTKKTYTNINAVSIGALATVEHVAISALEAGSKSTSYVGEVSELVTALAGLSVTNDAPVVGFDVESDPSLRQRCRDKLGALSPNGPSDAYGFVARSTLRADGSAVGVTRVRALPDGNGGVIVHLATAGGAVTAGDLAAIDDAIQRQCVPLAVEAYVYSAIPSTVPVLYTVWLYNNSGLTRDEIAATIEAELGAYFEAAPIGGHSLDGEPGALYLSELRAVIGRARSNGTPLPIVRVEVANPATDVLLNGSEVPVLGLVVGVINQIAPSGV